MSTPVSEGGQGISLVLVSITVAVSVAVRAAVEVKVVVGSTVVDELEHGVDCGLFSHLVRLKESVEMDM